MHKRLCQKQPKNGHRWNTINITHTFSETGFRNNFHRANPCVTFRETAINLQYQSVKDPLVLPYAAIMDHWPCGILLQSLVHGRGLMGYLQVSCWGTDSVVWTLDMCSLSNDSAHGGKSHSGHHINYASKSLNIQNHNTKAYKT